MTDPGYTRATEGTVKENIGKTEKVFPTLVRGAARSFRNVGRLSNPAVSTGRIENPAHDISLLTADANARAASPASVPAPHVDSLRPGIAPETQSKNGRVGSSPVRCPSGRSGPPGSATSAVWPG